MYDESIIASYMPSSPATLPSYSLWQVGNDGQPGTAEACIGATDSPYNLLTEHQDSSYNHYFYHGIISYNDAGKKKNRSSHWTERRKGGNGLAIACYVRVSSAHQADNGFSVDEQKDKLRKMIDAINPSIIYWFVDAGMTGTKFDNRAVVEIMTLKKRGKITELWICEVDRIGRDAHIKRIVAQHSNIHLRYCHFLKYARKQLLYEHGIIFIAKSMLNYKAKMSAVHYYT
jgi:resolvase-like protein